MHWYLPLLAGALSAEAGVFPYEISSQTLDNGLTVHAVPMPSPNVVAFYTWMDVGSRDEVDEGRTGFAHFFEHLLFYGTETLGNDAREQAVLQLGVDENAWTWLDETVYHGVLSARGLDRYIEIEADRFQNLALTPDDVQKQAGAVYGEFRKSQASPGRRLYAALVDTAYQTHTYGHTTLGYEADIAEMKTAYDYSQMFFDRFYRPGNATILVVGDVDPDDIFAKIEAAYGEWEPTEEPRPEIPEEPPQTETRHVSVDWPSPTATRVTMAWKIGAQDATDPDNVALELLSDHLMSRVGPLKERLIRTEGLAYDVWGGKGHTVDPGLFEIDMQLKDPGHVERAQTIVRQEIAALIDGVDATQLDRTRDHVRYQLLTSLHDPGTVAYVLGSFLRRNPDPADIERYFELYAAVTPADLTRVAQRWLVDEGLTIATLQHRPEEATP